VRQADLCSRFSPQRVRGLRDLEIFHNILSRGWKSGVLFRPASGRARCDRDIYLGVVKTKINDVKYFDSGAVLGGLRVFQRDSGRFWRDTLDRDSAAGR